MVKLPKTKYQISRPNFSKSSLLVFTVIFSAVGAYLLWRTFAITPVSGQDYLITDGFTHLCLEVPNSSTANNTQLDEFPCNSTPNQQFIITLSSNNTYTLKNLNSGKCVDVRSPSNTNGQAIIQNTCGVSLSQEWLFQTGVNQYAIINNISNLCIANSSNGITQQTCNFSANQSWPLQAITPPLPTISISANPSSIAYNQSSTITWSANNANSCTASGSWSGTKATSGSIGTGALTKTSTYTLDCTGNSGTARGSATVNVAAAPSPPPPPGSPPPSSGTHSPPPPGSPTSAHPASPGSPTASHSSSSSSSPASSTSQTDANSTLSIDDVQINNVTQTAVSITWQTNKEANGLLSYGTSLDNLDQVFQTDQPAIAQEANLDGLKANQRYYFTILASIDGQNTNYQGSLVTGGASTQTPAQFSKSSSAKHTRLVTVIIMLILVPAILFTLFMAYKRRINSPQTNEPPVDLAQLSLPPPPDLHMPYVPHSLLPEHKASNHPHKDTKSKQPSDMFEEGEERLSREGYSSKNSHHK